MSTLEQHYRRLIALYPAWHRRRYQAEMLSTLMDGASARQRTPRLRESVDLLWNAVRLRFDRQGVPRGRDPRWLEAACVFAVLAALTLGAIYLMRPMGELGWWQRFDGLPRWVDMPWLSAGLSAAVAVCWLLVAIAALVGLRIVAAVLAWATVLAFAGWRLSEYADNPPVVVNAWPSIVCGVTIAACLSVPAARPAGQLLGRWLVLLCGVGTVAAGSSLWLDAMLAKVVIYGPEVGGTVDHWGLDSLRTPGAGIVSWSPGAGILLDMVGSAPLLIYVASLAVVIGALAKLGAPIRRRLFAFCAAPLATAVIVSTADIDAKYLYLGQSGEPGLVMPLPPLTTGQWLVWLLLLFVPLVVFCVGVLLVRFADTRENRVALERL